MKVQALAATILLVSAIAAHATTTLVNPVTVPLGGPAVHLTPHGYDANGVEVPVTVGPTSQCTISGIPTSLATVAYDATGALLTAARP